jgi:hypothetical protein
MTIVNVHGGAPLDASLSTPSAHNTKAVIRAPALAESFQAAGARIAAQPTIPRAASPEHISLSLSRSIADPSMATHGFDETAWTSQLASSTSKSAALDASIAKMQIRPRYDAAESDLHELTHAYINTTQETLGSSRALWAKDQEVLKWYERVHWNAGDAMPAGGYLSAREDLLRSWTLRNPRGNSDTNAKASRPARVFLRPLFGEAKHRPLALQHEISPLVAHVINEHAWGSIPEAACHCTDCEGRNATWVFEPFSMTQPALYRNTVWDEASCWSSEPNTGILKTWTPAVAQEAQAQTADSADSMSSHVRIPCRKHIPALDKRFNGRQWSGLALDVDMFQQSFVADQKANAVHVFDASGGERTNGDPLHTYGSPKGLAGSGPGQLDSPSDLAIGPDGRTLAVADGMNHRVQLFDVRTKSLSGTAAFAAEGTGKGELQYAHGVCFITGNSGEVNGLSSPYLAVTDGGLAHGVTIFDLRSLGRGKNAAVWSLRGPEKMAPAEFFWPAGVAWNPQRRALLICDKDNCRIVECHIPQNILV